MRTRIVIGIAGLVVIVLSCHMLFAHSPIHSQQAQPNNENHSVWDGVYTTEQAKRGEEVYAAHCTTCHGVKLEGVEDAPSLTGKSFLDGWDGLTLGALFEKIRKKMPRDNPGQLSRQQYLDAVAYLLSANKIPEGKSELPQELEPLKLIRIDAVKPSK
ncbi:MAG TPA: c-type cytochrome [Candidatus Angelobacter sp.]|nr:c-type cytochrome [Candidatus Angelobacter sp.]